MRNRKFLAIALIVSCALVSCNEEVDEFEPPNSSFNNKTTVFTQSTKEVAYTFANYLKDNPAMVNDLHQAIEKVVSYDLDENLTVYDVLQPQNSVFFNNASELGSIGKAFDETALQTEGYTSANYYGGLNIYWGYCDEWDGKTMPIIAYVSQNITADKINGYQIEGNSIEEVIITSAFIDSVVAPVIIINFNETNYSEYPDFKNGKRTKNGVTFLKGSEKGGDDDEPVQDYGKYDNPNKLYKAVFAALQSADGTQYDEVWAGGSEVYVKTGAINAAGTQTHNNHRCEFTRKQIKKKTIKYYDALPIMFDDWKVEYLNMPIKIYDQDPGTKTTVKAKIKIKDVGEVSIDLPLQNHDDLIGAVDRSRVSYMTDHANHNNWQQLGSMKISMGLVINDRAYKLLK